MRIIRYDDLWISVTILLFRDISDISAPASGIFEDNFDFAFLRRLEEFIRPAFIRSLYCYSQNRTRMTLQP